MDKKEVKIKNIIIRSCKKPEFMLCQDCWPDDKQTSLQMLIPWMEFRSIRSMLCCTETYLKKKLQSSLIFSIPSLQGSSLFVLFSVKLDLELSCSSGCPQIALHLVWTRHQCAPSLKWLHKSDHVSRVFILSFQISLGSQAFHYTGRAVWRLLYIWKQVNLSTLAVRRHRFTVKLQKCFVNHKTSTDFPPAWR